jgi:hypothetical protein
MTNEFRSLQVDLSIQVLFRTRETYHKTQVSL